MSKIDIQWVTGGALESIEKDVRRSSRVAAEVSLRLLARQQDLNIKFNESTDNLCAPLCDSQPNPSTFECLQAVIDATQFLFRTEVVSQFSIMAAHLLSWSSPLRTFGSTMSSMVAGRSNSTLATDAAAYQRAASANQST